MIVDVRQDDNHRKLELVGLRWTAEGYSRVAPNEDGRLWLDPVGVWLGIATIEAGYGERVACYDPGEPLAQWIERTDAALYQAKKTGRDRVVSA